MLTFQNIGKNEKAINIGSALCYTIIIARKENKKGDKTNGKNNHYFTNCFSADNACIVSYNKIYVACIGYSNDTDFDYFKHCCIFAEEMR